MDEFTRTKVSFTIALLAALFTIRPLVERYENIGFEFLGFPVRVGTAYFFALGALGCAVYLISLQFVAGRRVDWIDRSSNVVYALTLLVPIAFLALWCLVLLGEYIERLNIHIPARIFDGLIGGVVGVGTALLAKRVVVSLKNIQRATAADEQAEKQIEALSRAETLLGQKHFDVAVVEVARVIELALKQAIVSRTGESGRRSLSALIDRAIDLGLLTEADIAHLRELRALRNNSVHLSVPIDQVAAEKAVNFATRLLEKLNFQESVPSFRWLTAHRAEALLALRGGNPRLLPEVLRHLRDAWNDRDGAIWLEISDFFEEGLINRPIQTLSGVFGSDLPAFEEWLSKIDTQIFTDFKGGDIARLAEVRQRMMVSMERALLDVREDHLRTMLQRLSNKLEVVAIREIE